MFSLGVGIGSWELTCGTTFSTPPPVSEGRGSAESRGPQARRPRHRRGSALSASVPVRGPQPHAADRIASAGDARRRCSARSRARTSRSTRRRGFRIFHAVRWRHERRHPLHVDEPGVPRRTSCKPHLSVVIFGDVKLDSTGLHFMNAEYELDVGRPRVGARPARIVPFYEKTGTVTPNMQRRIVRQALDQLPAGYSRPAAVRHPHAPRAAAAPRRARGGALSAQRGEGRRAERVQDAGAAPHDLRGVLPLPDRPRVAAPRDQRGAQAASCRRWTTASARRRRRSCRSS